MQEGWSSDTAKTGAQEGGKALDVKSHLAHMLRRGVAGSRDNIGNRSTSLKTIVVSISQTK